MSSKISRRDRPWIALISVSFILALAVSWERWGNPLVDCGREMNQPLRVARGEMLYSDVRHIYGPLSPYINLGLYKVFGPSLSVLYADGILTALLIIGLIYWLSRQLMGRVASTAATLSVMWLCAFKQAGNYILPYTYSAVHGTALGLLTLALAVKAVGIRPPGQSQTQKSRKYLMAAGAAAGLATLAKTEMGLAAIIAGVVSAGLLGYPGLKRMLSLMTIFILPVVLIVFAAYAHFASQVGWQTLSKDSFLFLQNMPPELVYFNKKMSGFDLPLQSLLQMVGAALRIVALALIIAAVSLLVARRKKRRIAAPVQIADHSLSDVGQTSYSQLWILLGASLVLFLIIPIAGSIQWDKGPYLAMPILLVIILVATLISYQKQISNKNRFNPQTAMLIVMSAYALASLARVMLRVRSGGAYSSYLLPASVVLFTYSWAHIFPNMLRQGRARRLARNIAITLILTDVVITAALLAYRYRTRNTYPIATDRGTIIAVPDLGQSINEAIDFIKLETAPGEPLAVMPEGTSLNFFTDRPNPLREEITTPGFLDAQGEERAIRQLVDSDTKLVLITNRPTVEFGSIVFGRDYCKRLMQWVEENFEQVAIFGPDKNPDIQIGDRTFFIRAYRKKEK